MHTAKRFSVQLAFSLLLLCLLGPFSLPINQYISFTLQTLLVLLPVCLFGINVALSTLVIYLVIGACGLPVFAGYASGLSGATMGYLFAFFPAIWFLAQSRPHKKAFTLFVYWMLTHIIIIAIGLSVQIYVSSFLIADAIGILPKLLIGATIKSFVGVGLTIMLKPRLHIKQRPVNEPAHNLQQ